MERDNGVIISSIALLQERFKQLQRVKAMRAEREELRVLPLSVPNHLTTKSMDPDKRDQEQAGLFFLPQHELVHGVSLSLSLWPNLKTKHEEEDHIHTGTETQLLINLRPIVSSSPSTNSSSSSNFEDMETDCDFDDIDTSLHL